MLAFGLTVVGRFDGRHFAREAVGTRTFSRLLKPISDAFQAEALEVNGLDRAALVREGTDPAIAMSEAVSWVRDVCGEDRAVLVAYPVAFDWSFLFWYFERFTDHGSPFGHSSCLDIRTLFLALAGTVFDDASKDAMPAFLRAIAPHTHDALDDAVEQGELFANIFEWGLQDRRRRERATADAPPWLRDRFIPIA